MNYEFVVVIELQRAGKLFHGLISWMHRTGEAKNRLARMSKCEDVRPSK